MVFCDPISPNCDTCFEVEFGNCDDVLTLSLGLDAATTYYLDLIDKFDKITQLTVITDGSGDFTIIQTWTEFFGSIEVQVYSDAARTILVPITQNAIVYQCVLLVKELTGQNQVPLPTPAFECLFSTEDFITETNTFITAVENVGGSFTNLQKVAINQYIVEAVKGANQWWDEVVADYFFFGTTSATQAINAKNPGTFDLVFVNTVPGDFTSKGWQPDNATSFARTGIIPSVDLSLISNHLEYYSRTNVLDTGVTIGVGTGTSKVHLMMLRGGSNIMQYRAFNQSTGQVSATNLSSLGGHLGTRTSSTDSRLFKNGVQIGAIATGGGTIETKQIYIAARNQNNVADSFTGYQVAGASVGFGISVAQAQAQYDARHKMNQILERGAGSI